MTPPPNRPSTAPRALAPRPLALHLAIQTMTWLSSRAALPHSKTGSLPWRPTLAAAAAALERDLGDVDPEAFLGAVDAEAGRRLLSFMDGVRAYRRTAWRRTQADLPTVWEEGSTRLLDYGGVAGGGGDRVPLLVVPSLINRGYILDIAEKRSLLRDLAGRGLRPLLVDWGIPGAEELRFSLTDYIAGRLERALDAACELAGRPVGVIGYCMGGLLALALVQRRPRQASCLVLMATPWDFHAATDGRIRLMQAAAPTVAAMTDRIGALPVDVLQAMFASLDPFLTPAKFRRFSNLDQDSERARLFVAVEDWLNDGVPLPGKVARECLIGWFAENTPARGAWRVAGRPVLPGKVKADCLVLVPERDHIVPRASATPLAGALPRAACRVVPAGHIGMVAGSRAPTILYRPLARWLDSVSR